MYTKPIQYGLQALVYLSEKDKNDYVLISEIAGHIHISQAFLSKIVNVLVKHRILEGKKGRGGGIRLMDKPENIVVRDVIEAVDGYADNPCRCIMGYENCSRRNPCNVCKEYRTWCRSPFEKETIADLAKIVD